MVDKNTKIYLDMDGVLADFFGAWAEMAGAKSGNWKDIPADQINTTLDQMVGTDFFNTLPKFPTTNTLIDLAKSYTGEYHINSSPLRNDHDNSGKWKKVWIKRELNPQPKSIILTGTKEKYAVNNDGSPNILIDDRGANIQAWANAGGIGIKYQADENTIAEVRAKLDKVFNVTPGQDPELTEGKIKKHPSEPGAYLLNYNDKEYKVSKFYNDNLRHTGEWSIHVKDNGEWEWEDTVTGRNYAIDRIRQMNEDAVALRVIDPKLPNWKEPKKPTRYQRRKELTKQYNKTVKEDPELNEVALNKYLFHVTTASALEGMLKDGHMNVKGSSGYADFFSMTADPKYSVQPTATEVQIIIDTNKVSRLDSFEDYKDDWEQGEEGSGDWAKGDDDDWESEYRVEEIIPLDYIAGIKIQKDKLTKTITDLTDKHNIKILPVEKVIESEAQDIELDVHGDAEKGYVLSRIIVPKELRNTGVGSKAMKELTDKADREGAIIALTPDNTYGGSKTRLTQFYKRFGFVPNKGRNKDFNYRETMIRYPVTEDISQNDLSNIEVFADRVFGKVGIDVEFTKHFLDRVNDERNKKDITVSELTRLFKQEAKRWGKPIAQMGPEQEAVMKDLQTDINLPFKLEYDKDNNELDLIAKTVMRKPDFKTGDKVFAIEDVDYTQPDFDSEWEEAMRYPQFKKMGKEAWIDLASTGKIININNVLSNLIYNTDAGEKFRNTWHELDADKKKRFVQALDKERVELPIIARWPDGGLELIGGNTRLTGLMLNKGEAKAWIFNA